MSDRPAPYPADTRSKGWRFELDLEQIDQSDTWALTPADLRPWLLMLWASAWRQTPCGSLPDDDALIAVRIGMKQSLFTKNRPTLLRGWWKADDGRLYHDTVAKRVVEMLAARDKEKARKAEYRKRKEAEEAETAKALAGLSHGTDSGHPRDSLATDDTRTSTGTSTSTSTGLLKEFVDAGASMPPLLRESAPPPTTAEKPRRARSAKAAKTSLPADFAISERVQRWADEKGHVNLKAHLESFLSKCRAKGYQYVDWDEAFMTAIRDDWAKLAGSRQFFGAPLMNKQEALEARNREVAERAAAEIAASFGNRQ